MDSQQLDKDLETWRIKRFITTLKSMRGNGPSMMSLIIPHQNQISRVRKVLDDELGTATNIKSPSNRRSVLSVIGHAQARLKLSNKVPRMVVTGEGKERRMNIDLVPFKALTHPLYFCDSRFHPLAELLEPDTRFGFIVMDGHGTLFGTVSGNNREVLYKIQLDLPKKHGRGGHSALRFSRLRDEKRHNHVRRVAELAVRFFISHDRVNVEGLSDLLDARLQTKILCVVDISYGGENGFNQAIDLPTIP
ncbi:eukaryotic translation termination factor 1, isoform CRA_d [Gonapodya prolifera JEL478]|uniref:Eukaryotic translation termination factor 1, isoform CRA_d n=1 Tax=Gonapodya prolifera (strain JEL478) TaxID=1344416 RepID=A0A139AGC5_GONPJ|nr:eukaryotic translation termination factor 1, isoform CRA_d [Gonapodya prolifera JEL478]|eukprot:KXS15882.1 eukaryotic translation termination factor 1, isoform CRA_d [Gonapodya prolifera JEL478]